MLNHNSRKIWCVADRKDIGSWLEGTPQGNSSTAEQRAERLGIPASGSGSQAGLGRRVGGLIVDWVAASAISYLLFDYNSLATLAVFAVAHFLFVSSMGFTLGHWIFGLRIRPLEDGTQFVGFVRGFIRSVLLALVIPAVVWDAEGRGLHDKAARTLIVLR